MQVTSAQASKMLKKLQEQLKSMESMEAQMSTFHAAVGENVEDVRPDYEFTQYQREMEKVEEQIRALKHAINEFNVKTEVPGFGITIDQMLILIPQLTKKKEKYQRMKDTLPKQRDEMLLHRGSGVIDYVYANYRIDTAKEAYEHVCDELARAQNALDVLNNTVTFEVSS